tara:strand:+ start:1483 stop:1614 length:132 start_codon:yes stop_codon:yes gene_type:complete
MLMLWEQIALILMGVIFLEILYAVLNYSIYKANNLKGEMDEEE